MDFLLGGQSVLFLDFQTPEHEGPEKPMDLAYDLLLLLLVVLLLVSECKQLSEFIG